MVTEKNMRQSIKTEDGYVLVGSLLILLLLVIIGIAATSSTTLELQVAGNDRVRKETFYQADGGTQLATRLLEESLGTPGGFNALDGNNVLDDPVSPNDTILIVDADLSNNENTARNELSVLDTVRDIAFFPSDYNPADPNVVPHTNIIMDGVTTTAAGSGLQMLSGYEGMGKGTAGGGGQMLYTIYSQHTGRSQSEAVVRVDWRHIIGLELEGRY